MDKYNPTNLLYSSLTNLINLRMYDGGGVDGGLQGQISALAKGSKKLEYLKVPDWGPTIATKAFGDSNSNNVSSIQQLVGFEDVTTMNDYAFCNCTNITSLYLPNVTTLKYAVFYLNSGIQHLDFPKLKVAGKGTFDHSGLVSASFPELISADDGTFYYCSSLESVNLPKLRIIVKNLFDGCTTLKSITLSDQITSVGGSAFRNVSNCAINFIASVPDTGELHNGIELSCSRIKSGGIGAVTAFNYSLGADVVSALPGTNLVDYVNEVLKLSKADVPLLTSVPAGSSVLNLGNAIANTTGLTQHGGLIDVIKIGSLSYSWNGSAWCAS
ncbi:MAG: leucine-rich repeat domain-containing protein [Holosporales bacterium]|nr:leucine-rich repeat domain-containing protein [Holosporales bacterium]